MSSFWIWQQDSDPVLNFVYWAFATRMNHPLYLFTLPRLTFNLPQYNKSSWQVLALTAAAWASACFTTCLASSLLCSHYLDLFIYFLIPLRRTSLRLPAKPRLLIFLPCVCREFVFQHPKQQGSLSIRKTEVMKRGIFSSDLLLILGPSLLASHLLTLGVG